MKLPDFIIAGVMKCGTSNLMRTLATHPMLYLPDEEVHYFDRHQNKDLNWYRSHFPDDGRIVGEKTPAYFKIKKLWPGINETLPGVKIILILRNPVNRAMSYWNMGNRRNAKRYLSNYLPRPVARALSNKPIVNRRTTGSYPLNGLPKNRERSMIQEGNYYDVIMKFLKFFNRERVLVVIAEEMWNEPNRVYAEIQQFLEVPYVQLKPVLQKPRKYPELSPSEIAFKNGLIEKYREPNQRLFDWLGRDIKHWT